MIVGDSKLLLSDIYLPEKIYGEKLIKFTKMHGVCADVNVDKYYSGYLGLNLKRLIGLMMVMRLQDAGIGAFNVPIKYRDFPHISIDEAKIIAERVDFGDGRRAIYTSLGDSHPLYWVFGLANGDGAIAGGAVHVDRVDGRVWTNDEIQEYAHDYNNAFWVV